MQDAVRAKDVCPQPRSAPAAWTAAAAEASGGWLGSGHRSSADWGFYFPFSLDKSAEHLLRAGS